MSEIDVIRQIAQQVLIVPTISGQKDNWLWDRTLRITRNVEHICRLPEIVQANLSIDRFCLISAAYFSDAGFARYVDTQDIAARFVLADVSVTDLRDFSVQIVTDKLSGAVAGPKIDKINRIIHESSDRLTKMNEAMILSDARNLDDMGAVGIFNEFRRYAVHGKGAADALDSWKRKIDYQYFQARLKESFRFDSTRIIASRRFSAAEYFMNQLQVENTARDLEDTVLESLEKKP